MTLKEKASQKIMATVLRKLKTGKPSQEFADEITKKTKALFEEMKQNNEINTFADFYIEFIPETEEVNEHYILHAALPASVDSVSIELEKELSLDQMKDRTISIPVQIDKDNSGNSVFLTHNERIWIDFVERNLPKATRDDQRFISNKLGSIHQKKDKHGASNFRVRPEACSVFQRINYRFQATLGEGEKIEQVFTNPLTGNAFFVGYNLPEINKSYD